MQTIPYDQLPEILTVNQAAELIGVNHIYLRRWIATGQTPMGEIKLREHYFLAGKKQARIIKRKLAELFQIVEKELLEEKTDENLKEVTK